MAAKDAPTTGETIGSYDLVEKIAEGGMGIVYKARHWKTNQIVAIKVLAKEIAGNPVVLKRFEQEFRVASKLNHDHIVKVIEYCATGNSPFIVMEYVDGESLGDRLEKHGKMPEDEALYVITQIAHGLHRAHAQGVIHRDVKPDNILIGSDNIAKLTDLGLAKDLDAAANANMTRAGAGLGTPNYMAPEQFRNAKNASIRCDVYSLGATLYHMVTGQLPFGVADPVQSMMRKLRNELPAASTLAPALSERVDWAIRRAMSADPNQRPGSCREFVEDLTGQSTRMDDEPDASADGQGEGEADTTWYAVYNDTDGLPHTASGTAVELRDVIKGGACGPLDEVRLSRSPEGPFSPLDGFPEFRDLVVKPGSGPPLSPASAANLAKRNPLNQGRERVIDPAPAAQNSGPVVEDLHLSIPVKPKKKKKKRRQEPRSQEIMRILVILVLGVATAVLAVKYLFPLLPPLR
jgi:eukaryotic-like serine/threonine-protein kinase